MNTSLWRIATPASALGRAPKAVVVEATELVLFRDAHGRPATLPDRCPHRGVPLSMGHCQQGQIVCRYHGWAFDAEGVCRLIPSNEGPTPPRPMLQPFVTREQDGYIWVAVGESQVQTAAPARLPLADQRWQQTSHILARPAAEVATVLTHLSDRRDTNGGYWWDEITHKGGPRTVMAAVVAERADRCRLEVMVGRPTPWPFLQGRSRYHRKHPLPASLQILLAEPAAPTARTAADA
ncbi:MAG: Rieske 2Fe-2S domain-containing protein [Candidatus Sericytochromatia bacterium]|nr:Rieske 2Fe-2S domain-containing protein [Candidatus Sericytochromatia bacterium]